MSTSSFLQRSVRRIERAEVLDRIADAVQPYVERLTSDPMVKSVLSGAPLGHRLHPMLTDVTIGCWTSASVLDVVAWRSGEKSARRLVALGIVSALPTAASGLSDWSAIYGASRRIGVVHMLSNTIAVGFEIGSWSARRKGRHVRGALLGLGGMGVATVGGYLGAHLVYAQRVGVDAEVSIVEDQEWHEACRVEDLVDGHPVGVTVEGARIAVVSRRGGPINALAAECTHAGGPIDQGEVRDGVIRCPWHGSEFGLVDGTVFRGPATTPQPAYPTRVRAGVVEVRRYDPDSAPTLDLASAENTSA